VRFISLKLSKYFYTRYVVNLVPRYLCLRNCQWANFDYWFFCRSKISLRIIRSSK